MISGNSFKVLRTFVIIGVCSMAVFLPMIIIFQFTEKYSSSNSIIIEHKEIIIPTIKLTTDGKTIDTIYIYKFKKY